MKKIWETIVLIIIWPILFLFKFIVGIIRALVFLIDQIYLGYRKLKKKGS